MTWFFAVLVVALIGAVAVVAAGRGATMPDTYDDRPDARVPADDPLTATDLRAVRFSTALRGYRMAEVDALLDRLAEERAEPSAVRRPEVGPDAAPATGPEVEPGREPEQVAGRADARPSDARRADARPTDAGRADAGPADARRAELS